MNALSIYFGPKVIGIVETKGKGIINNIQIPRLTISTVDLEQKVPDEIKIVALFKEELRRNKIETKEVTLTLSGEDLIVRTFELPMLPPKELQSAINFEVKKYIPFKVEDLFWDYQVEADKISSRKIILFVGIKKETLDSYLSILSEIGLKALALEYSAFSLLRLLKLTGLKDRGVIGFMSADFQEEGVVNFTVLENGFPLFSRDITLTGELPFEAMPSKEGEAESDKTLDKLKAEMKISLDFYVRKFPNKNIKNIFFICGPDYVSNLETLIKDLGLSAQFIEVGKFIGKSVSLGLSFLKGYSCSLSKIIKSGLKINLLAEKAKLKPVRESAGAPEAIAILTGLKLDAKIIALGLLICAATVIFGVYRRLPLEKDLKAALTLRPAVSTVNPEASYEELTSQDAEFKSKIVTLDNLIKNQLSLTLPLDVIPRLVPEGIWLEDLSFKREENSLELVLEGTAYLADSNKEFERVNAFLTNLKGDSIFARYFKEIAVVSLDRKPFRQKTVTKFIISCRNYYKEE